MVIRKLFWAGAAAVLAVSLVLGVGCAGGGAPLDPGPSDPQRVTVRFDMGMGAPGSAASMRGMIWDDTHKVGLESDADSMGWDVATRVLSGDVRVLNASAGTLYDATVRVVENGLTPVGPWPNFDAEVELSWYVSDPGKSSSAGARSTWSNYQVNDDDWNYGDVPNSLVSMARAVGGHSEYINWAFTAPEPNALASSQWPCFGGNLLNTRCSTVTGPGEGYVPSPIYYPTGAAIWGSPAIGPDGKVYVGCTNGKVYSLTFDGSAFTPYREYPAGAATIGAVYSTPAVARDGTVYVGSRDDYLYALTPEGSVAWSFDVGGFVDSSPTIGHDGTVYVGSWSGTVCAVNPSDGTERWSVETGADVSGSPAIGPDGTVYVASGSKVSALNGETGEPVWTAPYETTATIPGSPVIGPGGTIYVGNSAGEVHAINGLTGAAVSDWTYEAGAQINSSPALSPDGTVLYVTTHGSALHAVNTADPSDAWVHYYFGGIIDASPAVGGEGTIWTIYVGDVNSASSGFYAVSSANSRLWTWKPKPVPAPPVPASPYHSSPAIAADGTIYVGRDDGRLCAFKKPS